jgi:hypothetical protein
MSNNTTKHVVAYQTTYAYGVNDSRDGIQLFSVSDRDGEPTIAVLPAGTSDEVLRATAALLGYELSEIHRR